MTYLQHEKSERDLLPNYKVEAQGGYGEGKMWRSIKDQVTEIASHNVHYTFWED